MTKQTVTGLVREMVLPILAERGLELVEVEYKKEGANWMLRVFMDRLGGAVDLDDCAIVSEELSRLLDERDPIQNAYFLEVSSAGAERPLKRSRDYELAVGRRIHLSFYEPFEGQKMIEGRLLAYDGVSLGVEEGNGTIRIPVEKVASARLAVEW